MNEFNNNNNDWENNDEFVNQDYDNTTKLTREQEEQIYDEVTDPNFSPENHFNEQGLNVNRVHSDTSEMVEEDEQLMEPEVKTYSQAEFDELNAQLKEKEMYNLALKEERLDIDKQLEEYNKLQLKLETQATLTGRSKDDYLRTIEEGLLHSASEKRKAPLEMVQREYNRRLEDHTKNNNISKVYEENMTQVFKTKYNLNDAQMRYYLKDIQSELNKDLSEITFDTVNHMLKGKYGVSSDTVKKTKELEQVNRQRQTVAPRVARQPMVRRPQQAKPVSRGLDTSQLEMAAAQSFFNTLLEKNVPAEEIKQKMRTYPKWAILVNRGLIK